jgi:hypothetical protein
MGLAATRLIFVAERLDLRPVGGVHLRNKKGATLLWFKGKDPEGHRPFGLCSFHPDRADSDEQRRALEGAFHEIVRMARMLGMPLFDMSEFEEQLKQTFDELGVAVVEYVKSERVEDLTFRLTNLTTGAKDEVVFGVHPAKPKRKRRGEKR